MMCKVLGLMQVFQYFARDETRKTSVAAGAEL